MSAPVLSAAVPALVGAAGSNGALATWDVAVAALIVFAALRVWRTPAERWPHGRWSKLAWIVLAVVGTWSAGHYPIPLGALSALWRSRRQPPPPPAQGDLPFAEGRPPWTNGTEQ